MRQVDGFLFTGVPNLNAVIFSATVRRKLHGAGVGDKSLAETLTRGRYIRARADHSVLGCAYQGVHLVLKTYPGLPGSAAVCVDGWKEVQE